MTYHNIVSVYCQYVVQGEDSNPRRRKPDDLQSPLVGRLSIPAYGAACRIRTDDIQFTKLTL